MVVFKDRRLTQKLRSSINRSSRFCGDHAVFPFSEADNGCMAATSASPIEIRSQVGGHARRHDGLRRPLHNRHGASYLPPACAKAGELPLENLDTFVLATSAPVAHHHHGIETGRWLAVNQEILLQSSNLLSTSQARREHLFVAVGDSHKRQ